MPPVEELLTRSLLGLANELGGQLLTQALANPEAAGQVLESIFGGLSSHHDAVDVAQDALDAFQHGKLSSEAALKIVAIAMADVEEQRAKKARRIS